MSIDYGNGITNIDLKTGIRHGVISMHSVTQSWCDNSEPYYPCKDCEYEIGDDNCSNEDCEPIGYEYTEDGYIAESCLDSDIMIIESPFFTYGNFCSPCCPGAIDLNSPCDFSEGEKAYCFNHDWFQEGKAPYKVFSVKTGKEIFQWVYTLKYRYESTLREYQIDVYANDIGEAQKEVKKAIPEFMRKAFYSSVLSERK